LLVENRNQSYRGLDLAQVAVGQSQQANAEDNPVNDEGREAGTFKPRHQDKNGNQGGDEGEPCGKYCVGRQTGIT